MSSDAWVFEPTVEEIQYAMKVREQMARDPEAFEKLMARNPDKPVADEVGNYFKQLGMDLEIKTIEPMNCCYDTNCPLCGEEIPAYTDDTYFVELSDGRTGYLCADRGECSSRIIGELFKRAVSSDDQTGDEDDDDDDA